MFEQEGQTETGSLRDIWNNGYFWDGRFTRGADNRLILTRVIDRLTGISLQMAEKRTAANDLAGYYKYVTGADMPIAQKDRLDAWVSRGYDAVDYSFLSEETLAKRRDVERYTYEDTVGQGESVGRRKAAMIPFSDDELFQGKSAKRY